METKVKSYTTKLIVDLALDGFENMNGDRALLDDAAKYGLTSFRIYQWLPNWISLGKNQSQPISSNEFKYVNRPTGGMAVKHDQDVCVSIAIPIIDSSAKSIYTKLTLPIIDALIKFNNKPYSLGGKDEQYFKQFDCFHSTSKYDIIEVESGIKAAGCALKVSQSAALLQSSIPLKLLTTEKNFHEQRDLLYNSLIIEGRKFLDSIDC